MTCNEALNRLLSLDNGEQPDRETALHLTSCPGCLAQANRLRAALDSVLEPPAVASDPAASDAALTNAIMTAVRSLPAVTTPGRLHAMPLRNWLFAGLLILGGTFGLQYSDSLDWLRVSFGPVIDLAIGLILGLVLTTYLCILVGSNLERVSRLFRLR